MTYQELVKYLSGKEDKLVSQTISFNQFSLIIKFAYNLRCSFGFLRFDNIFFPCHQISFRESVMMPQVKVINCETNVATIFYITICNGLTFE